MKPEELLKLLPNSTTKMLTQAYPASLVRMTECFDIGASTITSLWIPSMLLLDARVLEVSP
jgi:hypothetical protein